MLGGFYAPNITRVLRQTRLLWLFFEKQPSATVVKMVDFSRMTASANSEDAVSATPPPQRFKAAPPEDLTREHRAGPRSSHPAGLRPRGSPNRIREASRSPQPMLRCKRRSQLSRDRTPVRPHVLHSLPHGYGEGDMHAIAEGWQGTVRRTLYLCAWAVIRHDSEMRRFYDRLRQRGKPGNVSVVTVMRKSLLQLNAVARRGTPWGWKQLQIW